jgi:hypothetical protein
MASIFLITASKWGAQFLTVPQMHIDEDKAVVSIGSIYNIMLNIMIKMNYIAHSPKKLK